MYRVPTEVVVYIFILMAIDVLGVLDISNRSLMRRAMHMYNRTSLLTNEPILDPYAEKMNQILTQDELRTLKDMVSKMPVEHDVKTFTRFNTSSLGLSDLENSDRDAFMKIYQDLKPGLRRYLENRYMRSIQTHLGFILIGATHRNMISTLILTTIQVYFL